jgi:hypothetical protein
MPQSRASEELLAAPLPDLIRDLGLAVANANGQLREKTMGAEGGPLMYTIDAAEVELKVAISMATGSEIGASAGGSLYGFSLNASYARTYNFKEEASSSIKLKIAAKPREKTPET